jgi:hypothetical protein
MSSEISVENRRDLYYHNTENNIQNNKKIMNLNMPKLMITNSNPSPLKDNFIFDKEKGNSSSAKPSSNLNDNITTTHNSKFILNLENLPKADFNDEFMEDADDFSPSWREACKKINLCKK